MRLLGIAILLVGTAGFALAGGVPEIDPSSGAAAFALLSGGLIVLRARRKK
jgi:MYXO-CTERM domain-containing protein